jgi:serine protease Do
VTLGVVPDYAPDEDVKGLRISGTSPGSPAAKAGLKEGDVLVQFNDDKVGSIYDLTDLLARGKPGQKVKIALIRDGKRIETEATLVERKSTPVDAGPAQENDDEKNPHGKKD